MIAIHGQQIPEVVVVVWFPLFSDRQLPGFGLHNAILCSTLSYTTPQMTAHGIDAISMKSGLISRTLHPEYYKLGSCSCQEHVRSTGARSVAYNVEPAWNLP